MFWRVTNLGSRTMRRLARIFAVLSVLTLVLAPSLADARLGGGGSFGSRGGRTYSLPPSTGTSPGYTQPMQRSYTPPPYAPSSPQPGYGSRPGLFGGGFGSGLLGGLIGAGIGGMLFGHGLFGGLHGIGSLFGLIIQLVLLYFIVRFVWRLLTGGGSRPSFAGMGNMFTPGGNPGPRPMPMGGAAPRPSSPPVTLTPDDYRQFEQILQAAQAAWTAGDLRALSQIATPEMVSYFGEQLAELASRGLHNSVTDVRLLSGDLAEAWQEGNRQYATVAMRFSMIDVTRDASGRIVDGSPTEHVTATEVWTFVRVPGGRWLLSAIQQTR